MSNLVSPSNAADNADEMLNGMRIVASSIVYGKEAAAVFSRSPLCTRDVAFVVDVPMMARGTASPTACTPV